MRAGQIAAELARQAESICRMLLPDGKREGAEWKAGDISGGSGKSLGVRLTGNRAGVWKDFADDNSGGDLIDLWAAVNGQSLGEAITAAKEYLGIRDAEFHGSPARVYTKPQKPECVAPVSGVKEWLMTIRGLSEKTIAAYNLAESGDFVVFPSLRDGELIRWKRRHKDNKHNCQTSSDSEPCLFGWQAIKPDARAVVICEGEIDACSWWQMGYPALSVPNGSQGHTWIEAEYDNLERFDKIYLSFDNDEPGRKGISEIIDRLDRERCRIVEIPSPHKDANDMLLAGFNVTPLLMNAKTKDPEQLRAAGDFVDEVIQEFYPAEDEPTGFYSPWKKVGSKLKFRYGEVTILAGANGHGKSEMAGHLTLDALEQSERSCIASMEFKPKRWLMRLTKQAGAMIEPNIPYIRQIHEWLNGKLWVFDTVGHTKTDQILSVFAYARRRYGIRLFVIDNLSKCGFAEDDYTGQKLFVDDLTDFAKDNDAHVILVAHLKKAQDETHIGNKFDVKGSGGITDMADTVLLLWRNKQKEQERRQAVDKGLDFDESEHPDVLLICDKQRNGEHEPRTGLWFDAKSHQYIEYSKARAKPYVTYRQAEVMAGAE